MRLEYKNSKEQELMQGVIKDMKLVHTWIKSKLLEEIQCRISLRNIIFGKRAKSSIWEWKLGSHTIQIYDKDLGVIIDGFMRRSCKWEVQSIANLLMNMKVALSIVMRWQRRELQHPLVKRLNMKQQYETHNKERCEDCKCTKSKTKTGGRS